MTTSNEHNNAPAVPQGWAIKFEGNDISVSNDHMGCIVPHTETVDRKMPSEVLHALCRDLLAAAPAPAPAQGEPFGYFRAEPFGWTDCAKDDEGAIALYERPQEVGLTDEERADMACAVAAIRTGASSRTVAATAIEWTERALRAKGQT